MTSCRPICIGNHTRDKQIRLPLRGRPILLQMYHSYDYRLNWTPLSPITITKYPELASLTYAFKMLFADLIVYSGTSNISNTTYGDHISKH